MNPRLEYGVRVQAHLMVTGALALLVGRQAVVCARRVWVPSVRVH